MKVAPEGQVQGPGAVLPQARPGCSAGAGKRMGPWGHMQLPASPPSAGQKWAASRDITSALVRLRLLNSSRAEFFSSALEAVFLKPAAGSGVIEEAVFLEPAAGSGLLSS